MDGLVRQRREGWTAARRAAGVLGAAAVWLGGCSGGAKPVDPPVVEQGQNTPAPVDQPRAMLGDAVTSTSSSGWYVYDTASASTDNTVNTASTPMSSTPTTEPVTRPAPPVRYGDEIVVAGQYIRIGAPVVLWSDAGGYDAYGWARLPPSSSSSPSSSSPSVPTHYGTRYARQLGDNPALPAYMGGHELSASDAARVRAEGWRLEDLKQVVDQFVLHYDVCGVSSECARILRLRGLSVHFMLDIDGTIYQTLDVQERAYHATVSNDRSVGIEIANIGAYPPSTLGATADGGKESALERWYARAGDGRTVITLPAWMGDGKVRTPGFVGSPARAEPVMGEVQGQVLAQYDLTPQQYDSLIKLTAALCDTFPRLRKDYPRDASGHVIARALTEQELAAFSGVLGHWHVQTNKIDPGPALDWEKVMGR